MRARIQVAARSRYCYACEGKKTLAVDWIAKAIELNRTK